MALPVFDATKHHIGLGVSGSPKGFMLDGGYVKEVQRESKGGQVEFGGQTDLIGQAPSLSRWTQDDFIGGMYAYNWGRDDAMFADCDGFHPGQQSRSLISVPPMHLKKSGLTAFGSTTRGFLNVGTQIYAATGSTLERYYIPGDSISSYTTAGTIKFLEYDSQDQKLWLGLESNGATQNYIMRLNQDLSIPSAGWLYFAPEHTTGWSFPGGTIFNELVVCQFGRKIYVGDPPENPNQTNDKQIKWRKLTRLPGRWKDSLSFNNLLYILINDGSFNSRIYTFDGDTVTQLCQFPFSFYAKCMVEYAGRIFVGGTGTDVNGGEAYAELYEVTGASVRLVRTFEPEVRGYFENNVTAGWPMAINDLAVHDGLLWFCQKGNRMVAYDVTSDGFFGASKISSSTLDIGRLVTGRGKLWGLGSDGGLYRIATPSDSSVASWNPTLVTSDFVYEIADLKRWSEMQVMTRYGTVSSLEYSVNSGGSWSSLTVSTTTTGQVHYAKADLSGITPSKLIRFRIKLTSTGDSGDARTYNRELVAYTVSFSMASETRKKAWGITVNASEYIETRDAEFSEATVQAYTPADVRDQLWSWMSAQTPLVLKDLDGSDYNVKIEALREVMPVIGPNVSGEPEAHFALTLLEV